MSKRTYTLVSDGSHIPLRQSDNERFVTPARDEHPGRVASRLSHSTRLALDPAYPHGSLVVWGEKQKLREIRSYDDIQNTRSAFQDPAGKLLVLTNHILICFVDGSADDDRERLLEQFDGRVVQREAEF